MTFIDLHTGDIHDNWRTYYRRLGMELPIGEPGSNPGGISLSPKIDILHRYGFLAHWTEEA